MMECIVPQPAKPPPTYDHFMQAETNPDRCAPNGQPAACAPDGAPGFVCMQENRFPPHPYAPKRPQEDWARLPCVTLPPPVPTPCSALPNYYPQCALRNRAPPCEPKPPPCIPPCCEFNGAGESARQEANARSQAADIPEGYCCMGDGPAMGSNGNGGGGGKEFRTVGGDLSAGVPPGVGAPFYSCCDPSCPPQPPPCEVRAMAEACEARRKQFEALGRPPTPIKHSFNPVCFEPPPVPEPPAAGQRTHDCPVDVPVGCRRPPTPQPAICCPRNPVLPVNPDQLPPDPDIIDYVPLGCPLPKRGELPPQLQAVRDIEQQEKDQAAAAARPSVPPVCRPLPPTLPQLPCCQQLQPCQCPCPPKALAKIMLPKDPKLPFPSGPPCYIPPSRKAPPGRPKPALMNPPAEETGGKDEEPPCYLPQPRDLPPGVGDGLEGFGGCGFDGRPFMKPVVDKYSLTRYTDCDWRRNNEKVLRNAATVHHHANLLEHSGRGCMARCAARADGAQDTATRALRQRQQEIVHWRCRLERALVAVAEEVNLLQQQRNRLKTTMGILQLPESIAGECIAVRQQRWDCDLVRDEAEMALIREAELMKECRGMMTRYLKRLEGQIASNLNIKTRCEFDWSDKKIAHDIEEINISYKNSSTNILFRPGAVRVPDDQSSLDTWDVKTKESIDILEAELEKSKNIRTQMDTMVSDVIRSMREQSDRVEMLLEKSVAMIVECMQRLEADLQQILQRIVDTERLLKDMQVALRAHDAGTKKVQSRLCNRLSRPRAENCRDPAQDALLMEVKVLEDNVSAQRAMICQTEENLRCLIHTRGVLEREIMNKRQALFITRDRIRAIRAHYPSAASMSGQ